MRLPNKLFKPKNFLLFVAFVFVVVVLFFIRTNYYSRVEVYVPVSHQNLLFKDGNVDISIQRVDEFHLHQDQEQKELESNLGRLFATKSLPLGIGTRVQGDESGVSAPGREEGAEVPVPDVRDDHGSYDSTMMGYLNYDVWHWIVGYVVDDMRINRDFPVYPDERRNISKLHIEFDEADPADVRGRYGHKIYGYLLPPQPGTYSFKVELTEMTAAVSLELWVSTDSDPLSTSKVLDYVYDDMKRPAKRVATSKSMESRQINLDSDSHYFEYLAKAFEGKVISDVMWKTPSSSNYVPIPSSCFAMAVKLSSNGSVIEGPATHFLNGALSSNLLQAHHHVYSLANTIYPISDFPILPRCEFTSTYAKPHRIKPYHGVYEVRESKVYPRDETWFKHWKKKDKGNQVIAQSMVDTVLSLYAKALNASKEYRGTVIDLRYLEETLNKAEGSRFLLEMEVQLQQPREEVMYTSEYVYLKKGSSHLCHTSNFQWTRSAEVHFIVSVKNLGLWVKHLISNMEDIYEQTGDEHFSLIIVDYESEDMDIEQEAKKSSFPRIRVMHETGGFSRSGGLQAGINFVKDKNSIVMTIDMHLTLPIGIVEYARRHTVQYKMAFTPMFFRLNKGYTEINYNGFWETLTYGLFSMYKSDWLKFGGFNTKKFKTKWGGEDWDIVDRSLAKGFETFRVRPPGLVHYHHSRKGMWGNSEIKFTKKWTLH